MLESIATIVLKYWVEFILGLIVAGGSFFTKRYLNLSRKERSEAQKEYYEKLTSDIREENHSMIETLSQKYSNVNELVENRYSEITDNIRVAMEAGRKESKEDDAILQEEVDDLMSEISCIRKGLLSIQGKEFRANCRLLLEEGHEISLDEWEEIASDHEAYNGLGGNHNGDRLFELVKTKFEKGL